ncbi:hypothetical protein ABFA25_14205 [Mycobacterium lepromatosis]|uniref:hypothetical protein n=1 Tax=Mycobacterium lepromatosis TaxID=480418 RepID=UPI003D8011D2
MNYVSVGAPGIGAVNRTITPLALAEKGCAVSEGVVMADLVHVAGRHRPQPQSFVDDAA